MCPKTLELWQSLKRDKCLAYRLNLRDREPRDFSADMARESLGVGNQLVGGRAECGILDNVILLFLALPPGDGQQARQIGPRITACEAAGRCTAEAISVLGRRKAG